MSEEVSAAEESGTGENVRLLGIPLSTGFRRVACHALRSERLWLYTTALAVLLTLPALWVGWQADDHVHRLYFRGLAAVETPMSGTNMFDFLKGDPETAHQLLDMGVVPWWTLPTLKLSFWRPLTSLTQLADYSFWPESAMLMHAHSLLWFAIVIALATRLYRRFIGATWVAGLAALLYAVDDAHGVPAGWLANRNALVAGTFCLLTLLAHDRWRRDDWRPGAFLAPILLSASLLSAELGVATLAYLFAYALFIEEGDWRRRVGGLLSYAAVASVWLGMYRARGHGTWGSGFYANPLSEPLFYLQTAAERLPVLLLEQLSFPVAGPYIFLPETVKLAFTLIGVSIALMIVLALVPLLKTDRVARFWGLGGLLCLLPVSATMPGGRLLLLSGLGAMGLVAQFIEFLVDPPEGASRGVRRVFSGGVGVLFVLCHVVLAPLLLPLTVWSSTGMAEIMDDPAIHAPVGPNVKEKTVVIVNPPIPFFATHFTTVRAVNDLDWPPYLRVLAPGLSDIEIHRPDATSIMVTPSEGFLRGPFDSLFRGPDHPLARGETIRMAGMTATVVDVTSDGRPAVVRFRFDEPLESDSFIWLRWDDKKLVPMDLPAVGETLVLEAVPFPF